VLAADRVLALGADLVNRWGWLGALWALTPVEEFLLEVLDRPRLKLPPLGAIRLDDAPGTAQTQLEGRDKTDEVAAKRIERLRGAYGKSGAKLAVAVAARGLVDGEPVPAEQVWPQGIEALARGVAEGVFEPVCHGWLHFSGPAERAKKVNPREFGDLDEDEAGRRIDAARRWQNELLGADPQTFVAPSWGYSDGTLAALRSRGLPAWHRAEPGPLLVDGNPRETVIGAGSPLGGVFRLDYGSLVRLARAGLPPTPALHGGLMDDRLAARIARDAFAYARLMLKRDADRLPAIPGIRWVGAAELVDRYRAHDASEVNGEEPVLAEGAEAVLRRRSETRTVTA
jgi:hypothetical protein